LTENHVVCVEPAHPARVVLFELVALNGVLQVVSEIGK